MTFLKWLASTGFFFTIIFIANKLSLEIDNDELEFSCYGKILMKDKN